MKKYKAVLFDFDGTLIDSRTFCLDYSKTFIEKHDLPTNNPEKLFWDFSENGKHTYESMKKDYWENFREKFSKEAKLFEGVEETLQSLKNANYLIGIVSTSSNARLNHVFKEKGLENTFDVIIGVEDTNKRKPDPEPVLRALKELDVNPEEALFIGNSVDDVECGHNAGVDSVFFVESEMYYGMVKRLVEESEPIGIIKSFKELTKFLI